MKASFPNIKYNLLILFLLILLLPALNSISGAWKFERKDENRTYKDSLSLDFGRLDAFPPEAEEYINDNFSFRSPFLNLYHFIKYYYFKVSPHPERTIIGSDGFFFLAKKEKKIFEGKLNFTEDQLLAFKKEWEERKNFLDSLHIKYYWVIAPFKHNIYSEHLPFNVSRQNKQKRVDQLKEFLKEPFPNLILDPSATLIKAKDTTKLFYTLDNHWNLSSGFITSQLLLAQIRTDFPNKNIPNIAPFVWKDSTLQQGIHYTVIGIESISEVDRFPVFLREEAEKAQKYGFPVIKNFPYPWDYEQRYVNKTIKNGLKVLFIRDSFAGQMIPFLKGSFAESVFIFDSWRYQLNKPIIEAVNPDAVVFIGLETHLELVIKEYE